MTETKNDEITPDELMEDFRGRSLKSILFFTVVIHAVLLLGTSVPFLVRSVMGEDTTKMSEDERIAKAVREATASLRDIAEKNGLNPQDISSQFSGGEPRKPAEPAKEPTGDPGEEPGTEPGTDPENPKPQTETEPDIKPDGPELPNVVDDDEDLFK